MTVARDDIDGILQLADTAIQAIDPITVNASTRIEKIKARAELALMANIAIDIRAIRSVLESNLKG